MKDARQQLLLGTGDTVSIKELTLCHRKKMFSAIDPVSVTNEELYDYIVGLANHEIIQRHFMLHPERFRSEVKIQYKNVKGTIDIYDKVLNAVLDVKTSRSHRVLLKPFRFHLEQCRMLCFM
jgi:hypothetical protein